MKKTIKFLSFFDTEANASEKRYYTLSATNKIQSIVESLIDIGYDVDIISMSSTLGSKNCPKHVFSLNEHTTLRLFSSIARVNIVAKIVDYIYIRLQFLSYLLFHTAKDEIVFVYHSTKYMKSIRFLKKIKKFKLVLEMEEIYGDVLVNAKIKKIELKLAGLADAFIFPTELLDETVNKLRKPSVIIHGTYHAESDRKCSFYDDRLHIVYAGILEPKKGAAAAIEAAGLLPAFVHIHILGYGTFEQIKTIKNLVIKYNLPDHAIVTYDGLLSGEEYTCFLQSCQIGLSTQDPKSNFNDTSFPSKILSYMANGLRVVSIGIDAVKRSAVGDLITYYYEQTPECIAKAIMEVDFSKPYDSRKCIQELNEKFKKELFLMIEAVTT